MKTWEPIIHNRAELKALGKGVLRGVIVAGVVYAGIRIGTTISGTAELVRGSVNALVMIVYGLGYVGAHGMLNLRDYQLRVTKELERTE